MSIADESQSNTLATVLVSVEIVWECKIWVHVIPRQLPTRIGTSASHSLSGGLAKVDMKSVLRLAYSSSTVSAEPAREPEEEQRLVLDPVTSMASSRS